MHKNVIGVAWVNKDKNQSIQYTLYKLREWWKEENPDKSDNIQLLKYLLLLYFIIVCERKKDKKSILLDKVFTELYAQPYGTIEIEVKKYLHQRIDKQQKIILPEITNMDNILIKKEIDYQVDLLKSINKDIINYLSFDLINLIRTHYSWVFYYKKAEKKGLFSGKVAIEMIKNEERHYSKY
jgi:hypothetical protein